MWASINGVAKVIRGGESSPADLSVLKELIEAEKVRTVTDRRYSLDQIREDHRYAEAGQKDTLPYSINRRACRFDASRQSALF
jgi:NADPH:quinone reductase-like Zn-dependent oxidoreductase